MFPDLQSKNSTWRPTCYAAKALAGGAQLLEPNSQDTTASVTTTLSLPPTQLLQPAWFLTLLQDTTKSHLPTSHLCPDPYRQNLSQLQGSQRYVVYWS